MFKFITHRSVPTMPGQVGGWQKSLTTKLGEKMAQLSQIPLSPGIPSLLKSK